MNNRRSLYLLAEAYKRVYTEDFAMLHWYKCYDQALCELISTFDGVEVDPDDEEMTSATIKSNVDGFPETERKLQGLVKQGKIKAVGGPVTQDMTGKARPTNVKYHGGYDTKVS